jgi:hypothetical protein
LALLGEAGIATHIDQAEDKRLLAFWSKSDAWPRVAEHATSISGSDRKKSQFSKFCPEVAFDVFGLFGTYLSRYADEIDRDFAHEALRMSGVVGVRDWRWTWAHVEPLHYSQCQVYSLLIHAPHGTHLKIADGEVLQLRPTFYGIGVDLKRLAAKIAGWWRA